MKDKGNKKQLVLDPVCGMWIEPKDAACETLYKGKVIYFCAPGCKIAFEKEPKKFLPKELENLLKPEEEF